MATMAIIGLLVHINLCPARVRPHYGKCAQQTNETMKKILIIERNTGSIQYSQQLLVDEGYMVSVLSSAIRLLKYEFEHPDIIIINSRLFNMTAPEICHHLQLRATLENVPVILAHNPNEEDDHQHCKAVGYLEKPFVSEDLLVMIRKHIG